MFERRLKIFLGLLLGVSLLLGIRAGQVQILQTRQWRDAAAASLRRTTPIETFRGNIYDIRGRPLAVDQPCTDACVDYRVIIDPPDSAFVGELAGDRLKARLGEEFNHLPRKQRASMIVKESDSVRVDIRSMWSDLAQLNAAKAGSIDEARSAIVCRVEMRRKLVSYRNYVKGNEKAQEKQMSAETESLWRRWLVEDETPLSPDLNNVTVREQKEPHAILHAISNDVQNTLGKNIDRYPGLSLRPGTHRWYPEKEAFCQGMGRVDHVSQQDRHDDPNLAKNELRQYFPNDLIGRSGVEGLYEQVLRGTKGRVENVLGSDTPVASIAPVPGHDISLTIDIKLQEGIEQVFTKTRFVYPKEGDNPPKVEVGPVHGAAVVIDVPTGEVRALASYPTYDLNTLDENYQELSQDQLNNPLFNRATMSQNQPGSTVKPLVGLSAITEGVATSTEGIECTGFLVIDGKRQRTGRCWVESIWGKWLREQGMVSAHHPIPSIAPHPTGFLTFADALERSCNVYFENMANRLGMDALGAWYYRWGIGRPTGIGIAEATGRIPDSALCPRGAQQPKTWFSGIGQDPVAATPIQMANVAATIARDGIWMRPRLIPDAEADALGIPRDDPKAASVSTARSKRTLPDRIDLNLSREGLAAAKLGMRNVADGLAGTGKSIRLNDSPKLKSIPLCCKTGTAQVAWFQVRVLDHGKQVLNSLQKPAVLSLEPGTADKPNSIAPWYRSSTTDGKKVDHAWFIGFAPADHPQIAFAVMVEYGGSGGGTAADAARQVLELCIDNGYLQ